jgi:hypothetical protein
MPPGWCHIGMISEMVSYRMAWRHAGWDGIVPDGDGAVPDGDGIVPDGMIAQDLSPGLLGMRYADGLDA